MSSLLIPPVLSLVYSSVLPLLQYLADHRQISSSSTSSSAHSPPTSPPLVKGLLTHDAISAQWDRTVVCVRGAFLEQHKILPNHLRQEARTHPKLGTFSSSSSVIKSSVFHAISYARAVLAHIASNSLLARSRRILGHLAGQRGLDDFADNLAPPDGSAPIAERIFDSLNSPPWRALCDLNGRGLEEPLKPFELFELLCDPQIAIFYVLDNGCAVQVSGLSLEDDISTVRPFSLQKAVQPPLLSTTAVTSTLASSASLQAPQHASSATSLVSSSFSSSPTLPAASTLSTAPLLGSPSRKRKRNEEETVGKRTLQGGIKETPPDAWLLDRPIFYADKFNPRRQGLPLSHPLQLLARNWRIPKRREDRVDVAKRTLPNANHLDARRLLCLILVEQKHVKDMTFIRSSYQRDYHPNVSPLARETSLQESFRGESGMTSSVANGAAQSSSLSASSSSSSSSSISKVSKDKERPLDQLPREASARQAFVSFGFHKEFVPREPRGLKSAVEPFAELLTRHKNIHPFLFLKYYCPLTDIWAPVADETITVVEEGSSQMTGPRKKRCKLTVEQVCQLSVEQLATPQKQVVAFIQSYLLALIPEPLWGGRSNRLHILRLIRSLVFLNRKEQMSISEVRSGLSSSGFTLFAPGDSNGAQPQYALAWVLWLLLKVATPLIRSSFYVTESEGSRMRLLYFRKPVWSRLVGRELPGIAKRLKLNPVTPVDVAAIMASSDRWIMNAKSRMGFATIRLVPKSTVGLRPIMNLSAKPQWPRTWKHASDKQDQAKKVATKKTSPFSQNPLYQPEILSMRTLPINRALVPLNEVLKYERRKRPSIGAASSFGYDGMFIGARRFAELRKKSEEETSVTEQSTEKEASSTQSVRKVCTRKPIYMFKADVRAAFDNLDQQAVLKVCEKIFSESSYVLRSFCAISLRPGVQAKLIECRLVYDDNTGIKRFTDGARSRSGLNSLTSKDLFVMYSKEAFPIAPTQATDLPWSFQSFAKEKVDRGPSCVVYVDQSKELVIPRDKAFAFLKSHVTEHIVYIRGSGTMHVQKQGVPQGSRISSLLFSLIYGHLERQVVFPSISMALREAEDRALNNLRLEREKEAEIAAFGKMESEFQPLWVPPSFVPPNMKKDDKVDAKMASSSELISTALQGGPHHRGPSLILRLTDDTLFISEDLETARVAAMAIHAGFAEYGITINPAKAQSTFAFTAIERNHSGRSLVADGVNSEVSESSMIKMMTTATTTMMTSSELPSEGGLFAEPVDVEPSVNVFGGITWCSFNISATGDFSADYEKYQGRGGITDALTAKPSGTIEALALSSLRNNLRPRCIPLLLDGHINGLRVVAKNVFEIAIIAGAKLAAILKRAKAREQAAGRGIGLRPSALLLCLRKGAKYLTSLVKSMCPGDSRQATTIPLLNSSSSSSSAANSSITNGVLVVGPSYVIPLLNESSQSPASLTTTLDKDVDVDEEQEALEAIIGVGGSRNSGQGSKKRMYPAHPLCDAGGGLFSTTFPATTVPSPPPSPQKRSKISSSSSSFSPAVSEPGSPYYDEPELSPLGVLARPTPWCPLRREEIEWLALSAFALVFEKVTGGRRRRRRRGRGNE
jgi:hypothetical protein